MATPYSVGHAMRRRNGTPASSLEAAGNMKNRNHITHEEAYDAASQVGSARLPLSAAPALQGTLVPKKSTQAGDPTNPGSKVNRQNIERIGAQYRITVPFTPTIDPAAGPTMANAKVIPSVAGRANPNFVGGIEASSL
jgi:hypothetical protein